MAASQAEPGAHWVAAALQVNPFAYATANGKRIAPVSEAQYDEHMVQACLERGIGLIGITNHWHAAQGESLRLAAEAAGVAALLGFEAKTTEGVHLLVLFERGRTGSELQSYAAQCRVLPSDGPDMAGRLSLVDMLQRAADWGAVMIAGQVTSQAGGLLRVLNPAQRMPAWTSVDLRAVVRDSQPPSAGEQQILDNKDPQYHRDQPMTILDAGDVWEPAHLGSAGTVSWLKMSTLSLGGLDLALRSPDTRVRLSKPVEAPHAAIASVGWTGGFLDGVEIPLHEELTTVIGGRGSGKTVLVESIRSAMGIAPIGLRARDASRDVVAKVLRNGTRVTLRVRGAEPYGACSIERTLPDPPVVRDERGNVLSVAPATVVPGLEIFGQHELAEVADDATGVVRLLERFAAHARVDESTATSLSANREQLLAVLDRRAASIDQLDRLPALQERLERFRSAGLHERLAEQQVVEREGRLLLQAQDQVLESVELDAALAAAGDVDVAYLSDTVLSELPRGPVLREARAAVETLGAALRTAGAATAAARTEAERRLLLAQQKLEAETAPARERHADVLRSLQSSGLDGRDYLDTVKAVEQLEPLRDVVARLDLRTQQLRTQRLELLGAHREAQAAEKRRLDAAATAANRELRHSVRVTVSRGAGRRPLEELLQRALSGRTADILALARREDVTPDEIAEASRAGAERLRATYGLPVGQAHTLADAGEELWLGMEEVEPESTADVKLNVGSPQNPDWRSLADLSAGQKATALLLLLLTGAATPLIIDQPEDDLDNRFVFSGVVPLLRAAKGQRQLVFTTHNANIPVLGDAELVVTLNASGGHGHLADPGGVGSADDEAVRVNLEELLEGGRSAFEARRYRYGF